MADTRKRWIDDEADGTIVSSDLLAKKRRVKNHKKMAIMIIMMNKPWTTIREKENPVGKGEQPTTMVHCVHVVVDLLDGDVIAKTTRSTHTKCRQQCKIIRIESNNSQSDDQKTSGKILQIQLINFMCHSNLKMTLGGNVNIIIGRNGSGKSAIMTGIIICLSGRPSITNRASSLKEFIKKDAKYARIIITLANNGPDAYRAVDFGPKIFLERQIRRDGHSTCKLKSTNGRIIANDKKELQNILEHYNIQIDNPACFLTQDASREFLESQNEAKKYEFFFKATQQQYNNFICASDTQQYSLAAVNKKEKEDKEKLSESRKVVELEITKLTDKLHNLQEKKASLDAENKSCQDEKLSCNVMVSPQLTFLFEAYSSLIQPSIKAFKNS
ncbi:uncharacterized protein TRIADDRAFT_61012 [Trichoplax adhaerens]|uniref:Rad50/SbcC-type AAA domain-containing protein n=1 Tax=Trichoplax adhaerens TaxID=10228 RepID=B3S9S6_TRIAD|nr:hypothetical protein TRIADDRAFT_61012 [Trichoplax adhaerens]EDV20590.1 hypothetical protein TRIADDRAFT_61012 [Trichoplax adhaerens]|eukprot:XP_002117016.1 hypothetical protein TRIADDRAFT_61012 [Trichoplax adhaerens]